jgi:PII-like signaling protein
MIYVGRQERVYRTPAFAAITDLLYRRGIAGATVLLGVDGTAHGVRERARFFARNAEVPVMIIAVGAGEQIARVLPELGALLHRPLLTLERVRVCKRDGQRLAEPQRLPGTDEHGLRLWQKLMVYTSEAAKFEGHAMHETIVERLRETGASGAATLRGVWGFHGDHAPHGDRLLQLRRNVPVVTIVVDDPTASPAHSRSSTRSPASVGWSPARWSRRSPPHTRAGAVASSGSPAIASKSQHAHVPVDCIVCGGATAQWLCPRIVPGTKDRPCFAAAGCEPEEPKTTICRDFAAR